MSSEVVRAKPFVKWVGGKRQLLRELQQRIPAQFTGYFEPFVGGGALFWHLHHDPERFTYTPWIGDFNEELINTYRVIRDQPVPLIEQLKHFRNDKKFYYEVRAWDRCTSYAARSPIERAARFIYLNKTGFNGLYRVNQKNQHNVPFGRYKNPKIVDAENLLACSRVLQHVHVYQGDFTRILAKVSKGDFVYLDPPYVPLNTTSNFTGYTSLGFDLQMQYRLRDFCNQLTKQGVLFMLSHSSAELVYDLYADYYIDEVAAARVINSNGAGRGKVTELIIRNYI